MKAKIIYRLLKPHLDSMDKKEKRSLSKLISEVKDRSFDSCNRRISLEKAKEKLRIFRSRAIEMESSSR